MCENPSIRLKPTHTQQNSQNLPGAGRTQRPTGDDQNARGRGLFVLIMALIGAAIGGRWFGLALFVSFSDSGTPFDLANALMALTLLGLLYRTTDRYANNVDLSIVGRRPLRATRAVGVVCALAASTPLFAF